MLGDPASRAPGSHPLALRASSCNLVRAFIYLLAEYCTPSFNDGVAAAKEADAKLSTTMMRFILGLSFTFQSLKSHTRLSQSPINGDNRSFTKDAVLSRCQLFRKWCTLSSSSCLSTCGPSTVMYKMTIELSILPPWPH